MNEFTEFCKRDTHAEHQLITAMRSIDYLLLQRDWESLSHGDLDFIIHAHHWRKFIEILLSLADNNNWVLAKSYEIERAVVSIVLLTQEATLFIDIAITPHRKSLFGVNLQDALKLREISNEAYIASENVAATYKANKSCFKASMRARLARKLANLPVVAARIYHNTIFFRGAAIYIPYIIDPAILRSEAISEHVTGYMTKQLMLKYSP